MDDLGYVEDEALPLWYNQGLHELNEFSRNLLDMCKTSEQCPRPNRINSNAYYLEWEFQFGNLVPKIYILTAPQPQQPKYC